MRTKSLPWLFAACAALQVVNLSPAVAADASKKQCSSAYEQAQYLRKAHKLKAAHEQLVMCLQADCPSYMSTDCQHWLTEVEGAQPSVVFGVRDGSGNEITTAKVSVDGEVVANTITGDAVTIDPGEHTFTFEIEKGPVLTQKTLIREGDKSHLIEVSMAADKAGQKKPNHTAAFIVAGVGVAGLAVGTIFGVLTFNEKSSAQSDGCKANLPSCRDQSGVDAANIAPTFGIVSDIGFGVAAVAAIGATYLFLSGNSPSVTATPKTTGFVVAPSVGAQGGGLSLQHAW